MKLKAFKMTSFILVIMMFISSCEQKEIDADKLCKEFYQLNMGKNFDGLYDVLIANSRVRSVYDESVDQYDYFFPIISVYDFKSENFITIPVFKKGANLAEKDSIFKRCDQRTKAFLSDKLKATSEKDLLAAYIQYVDSIYIKYYNIKTPKWHSSKNVIVEGHPRTGKFITFTLKTLTKICKCYFVSDKSSLNEYWSTHFSSMKKLDDKGWYYEISDNKEK